MQSLCGNLRAVGRQAMNNLKTVVRMNQSSASISGFPPALLLNQNLGTAGISRSYGVTSAFSYRGLSSSLNQSTASVFKFPARNITTESTSQDVSTSESISASQDASASPEVPQRIKFKRLDKTARHIMQIIDRESVEEVRTSREIPDVQPGYIVELKVEVPENKRRLSIMKGIVIARRNCGLNTTIRVRRVVAGVGIENLFHLYSPNIKEIKVLDKKKVRRAKLYYLREKMNPLKQH